VVLENIHRHMGLGKTAFQAALDATGELTLPVVVATLALIIVLCPIALTPGVGGFLFQPLTLAVAFAMLASFALSWSFVPALCSKMLRGHHESGHEGHHPPQPGWLDRLYGRFDAGLSWVRGRYEVILHMSLRNRLPVLAGIAGLFVGSLFLLRFIGQEFFPAVDAGQITLLVRCPSNTRLDAAERRVADLERFLEAQIPAAERAMVVSEIGLNPDWSAAYTQNAGQMDAVIRLQLTAERTKSAQEYAVLLRHAVAAEPQFADLQVAFDTGGMVTAALNFGASSPIDVEITGGTPDKAMALARTIRDRVAAVPGTADVRVKQRLDAPYLVIDVKRQKAAEVGLTARDVVLQVVAAMNSSTSINRNFWIDTQTGNQYFVAVQYPEDPERTVSDLTTIFATGTTSPKPIPLASLVDLRTDTAAVEINHTSLRRTVNVLVNTENRDIGGVAADITKALKDLDVPKGMTVTLKGEYARMRESFASLGIGLVLASVLVYLLMVPLMRSFLMPLIIMAAVPLGLIGVLTTLWATHTSLNVQSEMGVIFLVGIVVSQGVLLMDFANQLRKHGHSAHDAVTKAAVIRFKPILMTFLATFLDLLPMAIGVGRGSEALTPLARAVVGGLVTSTALTLIVIPVLFTLLVRDKRHPRFPAEGDLP
jgi:multidrug efflux pump subunit AcrB